MSHQKTQPSEAVIACNPRAIATNQRNDHEAVAKEIFSFDSVLEVRELPNGYGFQLPLETTMLHKVITFVANERLCCPFFTFTLVIGEQFWFELTGNQEVKDYIKAEIIIALDTNKFPTFDDLATTSDAATESTGP